MLPTVATKRVEEVMKKNTVLVAGFIFTTLIAASLAFGFERRRDPFYNPPGFLLFPTPYSLPGIGQGVFVVGSFYNMFDTPTDISAIQFSGDAAGYFVNIKELFLWPDLLYVNGNIGNIAKFGQNIYTSRGMETNKDDYNIFIGENSSVASYEAVLTLFERRLEVVYGGSSFAGKFTELRNNEGELIQTFSTPIETKADSTFAKVVLDLTDDYDDPRMGLNATYKVANTPQSTTDSPDFNVITYTGSLYVPIPVDNTLVFHHFKSQAEVKATGNTNLDEIRQANGFADCGGEPNCEAGVNATSNNTLNANQFGTADSLGGSDRFRAYPSGRYQAAQAVLSGAEFRWNFSTESSELDLFFLQDTIGALQLALFYEQGSVAEIEDNLGITLRDSYGMGFRVVANSGAVYRFDFATGDEGSTFIAFFNYPWRDGF
mgnify:CR=1 FL=1